MNKKKLLIVWVYYPAVGHVVEAIEVAANYHASQPDLEIHILLNEEAPCIIANYCDFIFRVHTVDVRPGMLDVSVVENIDKIGFDYVIYPKRLKYSFNEFPKHLQVINRLLQNRISYRVWSGYNDTPSHDAESLLEIPHSEFRFNIPKDKISFRLPQENGRPKIAVLLKGSSNNSMWPNLKTWTVILEYIKQRYPSAVFYITGITESHVKRGVRFETVRNQIYRFIDSIPGAINCYDIGLENQIAVIEHSDILIAPHTGFAFLGPCVGTPWLALSGGEWAEHMPGRVPFYSVLPSCGHYPCSNGDMKMTCRLSIKLHQPIQCMRKLDQKLEDIFIGIEKLLDTEYSFKAAFMDYEDLARLNKVNIDKIWRIKAFKAAEID
jgi:ADP-heptose:LPS heptosyltransferase